ncbi:MAG: hypothetical protein ACRDZ1_07750 [Acidimicrobiia bacterium]
MTVNAAVYGDDPAVEHAAMQLSGAHSCLESLLSGERAVLRLGRPLKMRLPGTTLVLHGRINSSGL